MRLDYSSPAALPLVRPRIEEPPGFTPAPPGPIFRKGGSSEGRKPMSEVTEQVAATFSRFAASYDAMRRRLIPCYDAFYGTALDLIGEAWPAGPRRILDLGAGTGLLAALLLERFPDASIHLIDASEAMLAQAQQRFAGVPNVSFAVADMAVDDLGGPWDAVASALAIHHLDDSGKQALFARVREALRPGGIFVNAEQVLGPTAVAEERYARRWLADIRRLGAPEDEIARAGQRMAHDRCASVEDQLQWLRAAGFADVDCSFKAWRFAVLSGRVPAEPALQPARPLAKRS